MDVNSRRVSLLFYIHLCVYVCVCPITISQGVVSELCPGRVKEKL